MKEPYKIHIGDCLEELQWMPDNSVDSIVTDPPYGLSFMGKKWDYDVPSVEIWVECLRVLKPGGHLLAFGGSRTYHRLTVGVEDAGFEIRDQIMWVYGSGFPKSMDVAKAISKVTDAARQWDGWGTALKPAHEPIVVARKPLIGTVAANVLAHGTGALNINGCRVGHANADDLAQSLAKNPGRTDTVTSDVYGAGRPQQSVNTSGRWPANLIHDGSDEVLATFPQDVTKSTGGKNSKGGMGKRVLGTYALDKTAQNTGGLGDEGTPARFFYCAKTSKRDRNEGCEALTVSHTDDQNKLNGAVQYRNICQRCERVLINSVRECCGVPPERVPSEKVKRENNHPTVKPTDLMTYLCRLVTPPGGIVFDPFMGSGSTGKAALREGFRFIGCELDVGYAEIALHRIKAEYARLTDDDL